MKNSVLKLILSLIIIFAAIYFFQLQSCGQTDNNNRNAGIARLEAEGFIVQPDTFSVSIRATGNLLAIEDVEIKTPVSGLVKGVFFEEGQNVSKGDLLVLIDNRSLKAQKKGLEATKGTVINNLKRKEELLKVEGVSRQEVERVESELYNLKARIEELDVLIDLSEVRAPFAGRLGLRDFSLGAYLSQGSVITRLLKDDILRVDFHVPAKYAALAKPGQKVMIMSAARTDTVTAVIYATLPAIDESSRSLQVRARFDNKSFSFLPGDFVQVFFTVSHSEEALLIPAQAIISEMHNQVIYKAHKGFVKKQVVQTGAHTRDMIEITQGVSAGDTVVITGLMGIREGVELHFTHLKTNE